MPHVPTHRSPQTRQSVEKCMATGNSLSQPSRLWLSLTSMAILYCILSLLRYQVVIPMIHSVAVPVAHKHAHAQTRRRDRRVRPESSLRFEIGSRRGLILLHQPTAYSNGDLPFLLPIEQPIIIQACGRWKWKDTIS